MRFGISGAEKTSEGAQEFYEHEVSIIRQRVPDAAEKGDLALWMLKGLGIVPRNEKKQNHPAVQILVEMVRRRKKGEGLLGSELELAIGKTQTYYWLGKMKKCGLVSKGKQRLIEDGTMRHLNGYYLSAPTLRQSLDMVRGRIDESLSEMSLISERLHNIVSAEEMPDIK